MRRGIAVLSIVIGAAVGSVIILVTKQMPDDDPVPAGHAVTAISTNRHLPADVAAEQMQQWVTDTLARPLFASDRRPAPQAQAGQDRATGLPRLSGIIITQAGRSAIFMPAGGGKSVVVTEGGHLGSYLVQSISIAEVVLIGSDGRQSLHLTFDRTLPTVATALPAIAEPAPAKEATP